MKFSYEESHVWMQRALCLENMGRYIEALAILKEVIRMEPAKVMPCLLAARLCYAHVNDVSLFVNKTFYIQLTGCYPLKLTNPFVERLSVRYTYLTVLFCLKASSSSSWYFPSVKGVRLE